DAFTETGFRKALTMPVREALSVEALARLTANHVTAKRDPAIWPGLVKLEMAFERAFVQAGGLLIAGCDPTGNGAVVAGYGDQREVELLVEAGFTSLEAIHIATYNGAQYLGELDRIGTLAPGKQADIVVVKGDPSTRISDVENVEIVFKDGIGYDPAKLVKDANGFVGLK